MKIYLETYGCSMNQADSELMLGLLKQAGYEIVSQEEDAELVIINTCIVKKPTESKILRRLRRIEEKKVIVAGCMPSAEKELIRKNFPDFSMIGPENILSLARVVERVAKGERIVEIKREKEVKLCIPKLRRNPVIEIVPICSGCLGNCSYCIVRVARGELFSYPINLILRQIEEALKEGIREIWITAQDSGAYGKDRGTNLVELLNEICKLKGKFFLRVGMMNPNHALEMLDELIEVYKNSKVFKFLHLPVQSGNDGILRKMNRFYRVEDFKEVVRKFRKEVPSLTLSTDIICGFPEESDEQFEDSLKLIQEIKPDVLNISRFWSRPGTLAESMQPLPGWKTKQRSRKLATLFEPISLEKGKAWIGWRGKMLVDEKGKEKSWIGRNFAYKAIVVKSEEDLLGRFIEVEIKEARKGYLIAQITNL